MPITLLPAADGFLPTSLGDLYEVPASSIFYVSNITLVNMSGTVQDVTICINRSGTATPVLKVAEMEQFGQVEGGAGIVLGAADTIEGETTSSSAVAFTISGALETP